MVNLKLSFINDEPKVEEKIYVVKNNILGLNTAKKLLFIAHDGPIIAGSGFGTTTYWKT